MLGEQHLADRRTGIDDSRYKMQSILLALVTAATVFAALPIFFESMVYKAFLLFVWGINFIFNAALFRMSLSRTSIVVLLSWVIYVAYCTVLYISSGDGYINGTYFYSVSLCIFIYINGCFLSHEQTEKTFMTVLTVYNACSFIVLAHIYFTNFWSIRFLETETYIYEAKNSIGPIIVSNMITIARRDIRGSRLLKAVRFICQLLLLYFLLLVNNRAGVIQLIAVLLCYFALAYKNRGRTGGSKPKEQLKKPHVPAVLASFWIGLLTVVFYGKLLFDKVYGFIKWALKLEYIYDLNSFSSGRISLYNLTVERAIRISPLFGMGAWYTDLFYLSLIAEAGIIGAIPVFAIILVIFSTTVINLKSKNRHYQLMALLAVQMLVASLFEGLPPFGPGTVVFVFWLIFGAFAGSRALSFRPQTVLRKRD